MTNSTKYFDANVRSELHELPRTLPMPGWLVREHSLPFDRLSDDEFEIFCFFLLSREHPADSIYHYGKTKDSGRDIIHCKPNGKVDLIQCKRYTSTVGVGEIRGELAKLCVNQFRGILQEQIDRVVFYVTPDLSGPAQDLIANQATWRADAPDSLKEFLGPKHSVDQKLLAFADSWWPTPDRVAATALTARAAKFGDLIEEFFSMRKVLDVPAFEKLIAPILQRLDAREARESPERVSAFKPFIPPASLVPVSICLERKGAVLLVGDPGAGKSELARELARVAQGSDPPIEVLDITEADHPTSAFPRLQRRTPVVYWVDDPFGRYAPSQHAAEWSRALAERLPIKRNSPGEAQYIVTSRLDLFERFMDSTARKRIADRTFVIGAEDYGGESRAAIVRAHMIDHGATDSQLEMFESHDKQVVDELHIPWSLQAFATLMSDGEPSKDKLYTSIRQAHIEGISSELPRLEAGWDRAHSMGVILLSILLNARFPVKRSNLRALSDRLRHAGVPIDVRLVEVSDQLSKLGWLGLTDELRCHPSVLSALDAYASAQLESRDAVLSALIRLWLAEGKAGAIEHLLQHSIHRVDLAPASVREALDRFVVDRLRATDEAGFSARYPRVAFWFRDWPHEGTTNDPWPIVLRLPDDPVLSVVAALENTYARKGDWFKSWWHPNLDSSAFDLIASSSDARRVAELFVRDRQPSAGLEDYQNDQFPAWLRSLGWDLKDAFLWNLEHHFDQHRYESEGVINAVRGALPPKCSIGDFEAVRRLLIHALAQYESWSKEYETIFHDAQERGVSSHAEEHMSEEWSERWQPVAQALATLATRWREEGCPEQFLEVFQHDAFVEGWARAVERVKPQPSANEVKMLLDHSATASRWRLFKAIGRSKDPQFASCLLDWLCEQWEHLDEAWTALIKTANASEINAAKTRLRGLSFARRCAIAMATYRDHNDSDGERTEPARHWLLLDAHESEVYDWLRNEIERNDWDDCMSGEPAVSLSTERTSTAESLGEWPSALVKATYCLLCVKIGLHAEEDVGRLLQHEERAVRCQAIRTVAIKNAASAIMELTRHACEDKDATCRRLAMLRLVSLDESDATRDVVIAGTHDVNPDVRVACVRLIGAKHWREGMDALIERLDDTHDARDESGDPSEYTVVLAALESLAAFEPLDPKVVDRLITFTTYSNAATEDEDVADRAVQLMVNANPPMLLTVLESLARRARLDHLERSVLRAAALRGIAVLLHASKEYRDQVDRALLCRFVRADESRVAVCALRGIAMLDPGAGEDILSSLSDSPEKETRAALYLYCLQEQFVPPAGVVLMAGTLARPVEAIRRLVLPSRESVKGYTWQDALAMEPDVAPLETSLIGYDTPRAFRYILARHFPGFPKEAPRTPELAPF